MLLEKIEASGDKKLSCVYEDLVFHYVVDDGIAYICLTRDNHPRSNVFTCLSDIKDQFRGTFKERALTASESSFNSDFKGVLKRLVVAANATVGDTAFNRIESEIDAVKGTSVFSSGLMFLVSLVTSFLLFPLIIFGV